MKVPLENGSGAIGVAFIFIHFIAYVSIPLLTLGFSWIICQSTMTYIFAIGSQ